VGADGGRFTGPGFQVTGLDMIRVRNGRVVEHWALLDTAAIQHQTGWSRRGNTPAAVTSDRAVVVEPSNRVDETYRRLCRSGTDIDRC
jgi:hypothetical protein